MGRRYKITLIVASNWEGDANSKEMIRHTVSYLRNMVGIGIVEFAEVSEVVGASPEPQDSRPTIPVPGSRKSRRPTK